MIIKDILNNEINIKKCISCELINGDFNPVGGIIYKNDYFAIVQDIELPINGFIVISSIRHIEKFTELTRNEQKSLFNLINKCLLILEQHVCDEYNIILEEKSNYHFHVWLMPRHKWMIEKFGKVLKNISQIQKYSLENLKTDENIKEILKTCNLLKKELNK